MSLFAAYKKVLRFNLLVVGFIVIASCIAWGIPSVRAKLDAWLEN